MNDNFIYVCQIEVLPRRGGGPPRSQYRTILYTTDFNIAKERSIEYKKKTPCSDIWGHEKRWGKIRIECFKEDKEVTFPEIPPEVYIIY